jgi:hypothetical protein
MPETEPTMTTGLDIKRRALVQQVEALRAQVAALTAENSALRAKLDLFEKHPTLARGLKGEQIVAKLLGGAPSSKNASHDLELKQQGILIEVKYANLNRANPHAPTRRWAWPRVFGEGGKKKYHRLILLGDTDPSFRRAYLDPDSPYVLFDVPYAEVAPLTIQTGHYKSIHLSTNPAKARSAGAPLFKKYQVTFAELKVRYGIASEAS